MQSEIRLGHAGVSRSSPDYYALRVLNAVLGGQFVSRVNLNLREDKGYTYGARTSFDWRVSRGPFSLQANVQTAATIDAIREAVKEISDIRGSCPLTDQELDLAKAALTRGFPHGFETALQVARAALQLALHQLPDDTHEQSSCLGLRPLVTMIPSSRRAPPSPRGLGGRRGRLSTDVFGQLAGLGLGDPVERPIPS